MNPSKIHLHTLQTPQKPVQKRAVDVKGNQSNFQQLLANKISEQQDLKVSKHAQQRMEQRGIEFTADKWQTIQDKVQEAKRKGVTDSLVITNNAALVVSAKNETVITVLDRNEAEAQIFTNINGTIMID